MMKRITLSLGVAFVALASCNDIASIDLKWEGPNGEVSVYNFTGTDTDLTDDSFPDYPLISVANHATRFRIDDQHTALFCRDPFFGPPCTELTGDGVYHPFFFVVNPASVEVYKNEWMADISSIGSQSTYPHMVWTPDLSYHVEGIAHTSTHLFVSTLDDLYRVPIGEDLQQVDPDRISFGGVPCGDEYLNHVGDIAAIGDSFVLAPIEQWPPDDNVNAKLAILDTDLNLLQCIPLPVKRAGAVAYNPTNGLVYLPGTSSETVRAVKIDTDTGAATILYDVTLEPPFYTGDAMTFSDSGHLYVANRVSGNLVVAAYKVRGRSALQVAQRAPAPVDAWVEGIDVFDAGSISGINPNITGQVHVGLLDNIWPHDQWSMLHFHVDDPSAL